MRRIQLLGAAVIATMVMSACGGTESSSNSRSRNAALAPTLVNGGFLAAQGGWQGTGFTLGRGCGANTSRAWRPSLGEWKKGTLAFGRRAAEITQTVVIDQPSQVQFTITGAVRKDDLGGWFAVTVADGDETVTTDRKTGKVASTPQVYTLGLTTTSASENVTITLAGSGNNSWRGCYGPFLSDAALTATPTVVSTTTLPPTTTTVASTTTTVTTTTQATAASAETCRLTYDGYRFTACKPLTEYSFQFFDDQGPISGTYSGSYRITEAASSSVIRPVDTGASSMLVKVSFRDGSKIADLRISIDSTTEAKFTTPATLPDPATQCEVTVSPGRVWTCKIIDTYSYVWWNDSRAISGRLSSSSNKYSSFSLSPANLGTKQIQITLTFADGTRTGSFLVPYDGKTQSKTTVPIIK